MESRNMILKIICIIIAIIAMSVTCICIWRYAAMKNEGITKKSLKDESYRPLYHYSIKENWGNDPNGLVYYEGEYHFFYQCNPYKLDWGGDKYWAHSVSKDLLHWEDLPLALKPDDLGCCWSGSVVADYTNSSGLFTGKKDHNGNLKEEGLVAIYTSFSVNISQSIAYSWDNGRTWSKYADNPVIDMNNNPGKGKYFRDPKVFWHEESNQWMMVISGGPLMIYTSPNLIDWTNNSVDYNLDTECPDLFRINIKETGETKWVLLMSGQYFRVGSLTNTRGKWSFVSETESIPMQFGPDVYATQTWSSTPGGRILSISWLCNPIYVLDLLNVPTPYSGTYSLINEMELSYSSGVYRLIQKPIEEYIQLRSERVLNYNGLIGADTNINPLSEFSGNSYEIVAEFTPCETTTEFGFNLFVGDSQVTVIRYDVKKGKLIMDRTLSGKTIGESFLYPGIYDATVDLTQDSKLKLHIFVDKSVIDVYCNDGMVLGTMMVYPDSTCDKAKIYSIGGDTYVSYAIYPIK